MAQHNKVCQICGELGHSRFYCKNRKPKPIKQKGKHTIEYEKWRDTIARPYLIETFGEICVACQGTRCNNQQLDVEHKLGRGSHHQLKMELSNVQLMGRYPCHYEKTNGITPKEKE